MDGDQSLDKYTVTHVVTNAQVVGSLYGSDPNSYAVLMRPNGGPHAEDVRLNREIKMYLDKEG